MKKAGDWMWGYQVTSNPRHSYIGTGYPNNAYFESLCTQAKRDRGFSERRPYLFTAGWALRAEEDKHCSKTMANNPAIFE